MYRLGLRTLGVASVFVYASTAAAQGTGDTAATAALAAAPAAAPTGTPKPISFGILAGITVPSRALSYTAGTGWHAGALLNVDPGWPVSFRLEGAYDGLGSKDVGGNATLQEHFQTNIIRGTINALWHLPLAGDIKPYIIGGIGLYRESSDEKCIADTAGRCAAYNYSLNTISSITHRFGVNAGAGIDMHLTGFWVFSEARWNDISTTSWDSGVPIFSVGLHF
jgi:hypothetical protein